MFSQQRGSMEVIALCNRLLINALLLLAVVQNNVRKADAAFPHIDPNRLQFFEYESISVNCEELDLSSEWRVMRKPKENPTNITEWETSTRSITAEVAFTSHSGEYWCENKNGERSNSVNITVTGGDVILESPALPVMEGDDVSLHCRDKMAASNLPADFYKDGRLSATGYKGDFSINSVSKSDEGFYKCSISGDEESAESWLAVRDIAAHITSSPEDIRETPATDVSSPLSILPSVILTMVCVALLVLMVVGLLHCQKHAEPGASSCSARQTFSALTRRHFRDNNAVCSQHG